jgi:carboxymethylenebutenolidase
VVPCANIKMSKIPDETPGHAAAGLGAANQQQQASEWASQYVSGAFSRREFLSRLVVLTGSMAAAHVLLEREGLAQVISTKETAEEGIAAQDVFYSNGEGKTDEGVKTGGYLCTPQGAGPFPAILVIHENRGLNEHTRDVARRFAAAGFVALAPDALARVGGTARFATPDEARTAIGTISPEEALTDLEAGLAYLATLPTVRKGQIASIGFCWGGARSFALATQSNLLKAAVVFYGSAPSEEKLKQLKVPVLGIYGELDTRITGAVPEVEKTLQTAGKSFEVKIYEGANHAFFNDTGERYNEKAAKDAWERTLQFLRARLA